MRKDTAAFRPAEDETAGEHPFRRLFLDATVTEESEGLKRVFHAPKKYRGNPVLKAEMPWEGSGIAAGGTVMWRGDKIVIRYKSWGKGSAGAGMAESVDGIHFTRPNLGIVEYNGSKNNNMGAGHGSIIKMRKPPSPEQQWGSYGYGGKEGAKVSFSEDGIHWRKDSAKGGLFGTSDVVYFFYDPYEERYVSTYKTSNRRHRAVGLAISEDGLEWHKPIQGAVFGADDLDPDPTQIYGMPVFPYQGIYIGLPWIYHARWLKHGAYNSPQDMYEAQEDTPCTIDTQFAWSWDLISWNRTPKREPFVGLGEPGSWDTEMVATARNPVLSPDGKSLYFYYGGYETIHDTHEAVCGCGLAILRMDGFCSMHAGKNEGSLISRREVFRKPQVAINAKCGKDGCVAAELVDRHNNVIPGFARKECIPFTGDSIKHVLQWKAKAFPAEVNVDKKIRFFLKDADLYSYLPVDIDLERDKGNRRAW